VTPPKAGFRAPETACQAEGMSWGRTITLSVVAIALTTTLVSCSAAADTLRDLAAATPTAAVTPAAKPLEGDLNGDGKLTAFETEWLAKTKAETAVRDYTLLDGTVVQVDPAQALTDPVRADIAAQFADDIAVTQSTTDGGTRDPRTKIMIDKINTVAGATGRDIVIIYPSLSRVSSDVRQTATHIVWSSINNAPEGGNPFTGPNYDVDREAYIAKATEVAGDKYDVIVVG